jgi:hypothetical protein
MNWRVLRRPTGSGAAQSRGRPLKGNAGEGVLERSGLASRASLRLVPQALLGETAQRRAARTLAGSLLLTVADLRAHPPLLATLFAAALTRLLRTQVQPALRGVANRVAGPAGVYRGGNAVRRPRAPHGSGRGLEAASADEAEGVGPGERDKGAVSPGAARIVGTRWRFFTTTSTTYTTARFWDELGPAVLAVVPFVSVVVKNC